MDGPLHATVHRFRQIEKRFLYTIRKETSHDFMLHHGYTGSHDTILLSDRFWRYRWMLELVSSPTVSQTKWHSLRSSIFGLLFNYVLSKFRSEGEEMRSRWCWSPPSLSSVVRRGGAGSLFDFALIAYRSIYVPLILSFRVF